MTATIAALPPEVGRVLAPGERPKPRRWLVDGLIGDEGLTAIAINDSKDRTSFGVTVMQGVQNGGATVAGRIVVRPAARVLVLASSEYTASVYRQFGDDRATVAALHPWDASDERYWDALYGLADDVDIVLVDTVQELASGNVTAVICATDGPVSSPGRRAVRGQSGPAGSRGETTSGLALVTGSGTTPRRTSFCLWMAVSRRGHSTLSHWQACWVTRQQT